MAEEFELSWERRVEIHEGSLQNAHLKLFEAQNEREVWRTVANTTKPGGPENSVAKQQMASHGMAVKYAQTSIEHHTRELAFARSMVDPTGDDRAVVDLGDNSPVQFPHGVVTPMKTADA